MVILNHIPRTAGTFLLAQLRQAPLANGYRTIQPFRRMTPRIYLDHESRPSLLVYHTSGTEFARHFKRRKGDWVFTFLRNRVDMLYSNFAYMKQRVERGDRHCPDSPSE